MSLPRFRIRTPMIVVAVAAVVRYATDSRSPPGLPWSVEPGDRRSAAAGPVGGEPRGDDLPDLLEALGRAPFGQVARGVPRGGRPEVDDVDRRDAGIIQRQVIVHDRGTDAVAEGPGLEPTRHRPDLPDQAGGEVEAVRLASDRQVLVADHVEHQAGDIPRRAGVPLGIGPREFLSTEAVLADLVIDEFLGVEQDEVDPQGGR